MIHFGFSYMGLIFLLMLFIPNIIWTKHKPKDYEQYVVNENKVLLLFERIGEILICGIVLIFSDFNLRKPNLWTIWLILAVLLMLCYEGYWIRYFRSEQKMTDFYSTFLGIPVAGASLPVAAFFFLGIYGAIVLLIGGEGRFIVENGFQSLGKMFQNFIGLCTYTDPGRTTNFPQDWTIYYWAYWMVWSVAAPFFIGNISRGRTIKQTILGGYVFGVGSTIISFIVLGNYSLGLQTSGAANFIAKYAADGDLYGLILSIIDTMPMSKVILGITVLCMIAFYATSFDSIAYTAACYSYKQLGENV